MSQAPTPLETGGGYAPPSVTQFAVFLDNRVGKLRELTCIFEAQALTLGGLTVVDAVSYAVCRIVTSNAALCRRLLERAGLPYSEVDILAIELTPDHTLTEVCQFLTTVEVNIHYVYPLWVQPRGYSVMALYADDLTFAAQVLRKKHITLLGENDLGENAPGSSPGKPNDPFG